MTDKLLELAEKAGVTITRLDSGYYHIRGAGPCEWAQPPWWPCDGVTLRAHAFPEASERFIRRVVALAERAMDKTGERP